MRVREGIWASSRELPNCKVQKNPSHKTQTHENNLYVGLLGAVFSNNNVAYSI